MLTVSDLELCIERDFGSRLEPLGFQRLGERKWVRSQKLPIRELFVISALKGAQYSPVWGFSCGIVPSLRSRTFRRQSSDKNSIMDLIIDPIDITGEVPPQAFGFITGQATQIPTARIQACAEHFVPNAMADFDRVHSLRDFCQFFHERSRLEYRRLTFDMYVQHQLVHGFVLIMEGRRDEGLERIRGFCRNTGADLDSPVLSECIRYAETNTIF